MYFVGAAQVQSLLPQPGEVLQARDATQSVGDHRLPFVPPFREKCPRRDRKHSVDPGQIVFSIILQVSHDDSLHDAELSQIWR